MITMTGRRQTRNCYDINSLNNGRATINTKNILTMNLKISATTMIKQRSGNN